ncbi:CRISPR type III-associated RAMP domain-containing protein [Desulfonema limicola]|uniref:CRISPR type III-associated RAMP domain-containing protein n=1 Tax=Desulfonema limicola TaxID=45656 RepID=A0A975BA06_9BACT|nr:RAMP superfamily CRISPR-associated protein [Desulfonema limicola]QTA81754.1 CRISPR type III-associated RAMP domain-containing protein [Desulfonema limicola]
METNKLYLAKGKIEVKAKGYWFTSGGEKGPFGFYPHLKDENGKPVFPDTQIHGDLRMAANWLTGLNSGFDQPFVEKVFGKGGESDPALLKITDLELQDCSKDLFEIKPRIRIDDKKGTVEKHMLVDREVSFLDGCTLEAQVYLGYFKTSEEMEKAVKLLEESAKFLSGFGGFRSRGYGRGEVSVKIDDKQEINPGSSDDVPKEFPYMAKALVHFRNREVDPGKTQRLSSVQYIASEQLRAWFVKTWNDIYPKTWPSFEEMASISFPSLYPCSEKSPAWIPPMSTLKNEDNKVNDMRGKNQDDADRGKDEQENFFNTKTKGLGQGYFVTNEPAVTEKIKTEYRIRNSIDGLFVTRDDGLFVQELIKKHTCFSGIIQFKKPGTDFSKKAYFILNYVKPVIKGAVFERVETEFKLPDNNNGKSFLVVEPINYENSFISENNQVTLDSIRRYNTMLGRPRRSRIVIAPCSILSAPVENQTIAWAGFGFENIPFTEKPEKEKKCIQSDADKDRKKVKSRLEKGGEWEKKNWVITRSQAGLLREYLHPGQEPDQILNNLRDRIEKYSAKSQEKLKSLLSDIKKELESKGIEEMQKFIRQYLDELAIYLFNNKKQ